METIVNMLRRRWWIIALPAIVAFLLLIPAFLNALNPDSTYSIVMRFTAAAPASETTTYEDTAYIPWLASEYVVVNFPQWVTSDSFAREVSAELAAQGIEISAEDVRPAFIADSARSYLIVYMTWDDETEIEAIAHAAVKVLQTRNQIYFPQFAASPAEVIAWDDVRVNTVTPPITTRLNPFVRLAFALAAGIGLAAVFEYFDDTLRTSDDVQALGLNLIGKI